MEDLVAIRSDGRGRLVTVRGRRRIGKSWLIEEFIERSKAPHVFFAASRQTSERELTKFADRVARSSLPSASAAVGVTFDGWEAALVLAATAAEQAQPSIVVIDEFPYLLEGGRDAVEGAVQAAWDRVLSRTPVLLILVGSDLAMMRSLDEYGRPLHGRPSRGIVVDPLSPTEVGQLLKLPAAEALDAYLVVGGFPEVARAWQPGQELKRFLAGALADESSPLVATGRRILESEFPSETQARSILSVIGAGTRTYTAISNGTGIASTNLNGPLKTLIERKRIVEARLPLAAASSKDRRYEIADPYLRFYLRFLDPNSIDIERGRSRLVTPLIWRDWSTYRGRAIEPLVREAIGNLLPDGRVPGARYVGGYWTRQNEPEIDLIGADKQDPPAKVAFIGSIKWRDDHRPFGWHEINDLRAKAASVAGVTPSIPVVGVSRSAFGPGREELALALTADDLIGSWAPA
jgi:AAA+ ATPase superfamily predicted ATPase